MLSDYYLLITWTVLLQRYSVVIIYQNLLKQDRQN